MRGTTRRDLLLAATGLAFVATPARSQVLSFDLDIEKLDIELDEKTVEAIFEGITNVLEVGAKLIGRGVDGAMKRVYETQDRLSAHLIQRRLKILQRKIAVVQGGCEVIVRTLGEGSGEVDWAQFREMLADLLLEIDGILGVLDSMLGDYGLRRNLARAFMIFRRTYSLIDYILKLPKPETGRDMHRLMNLADKLEGMIPEIEREREQVLEFLNTKVEF